MPWKNGRGETREIAIFPEQASLEDFDWRVSTAKLEGYSVFSSFPGVDRSVGVLDGGPLVISRPGSDATRNGRSVIPVMGCTSFPGEASIIAHLPAGADQVTDFNVMTRRRKYRHVLDSCALHGDANVRGCHVVLQCVKGCLEVHSEAGDDSTTLSAGEAVVASGEGRCDVELHLSSASAQLYVVRMFQEA
jgi:environmental stress-induced protein Ves